MSARELTVAHQSPGECAWCDSRHAAIVATVAHELAEKIRAHALEWQENYKYHWFEGQQDAADLIDPEVSGG